MDCPLRYGGRFSDRRGSRTLFGRGEDRLWILGWPLCEWDRDVATLAVYGSYAALVDLSGHAGAFALLMLPYLAIAFWLRLGRFSQTRPGHA